jgi:hypothetical protein
MHAGATPILDTNIAEFGTVSGSGAYSSDFSVDNVIDGSTYDYAGNYWLTPNGQTGWVMVDLLDVFQIGRIEFLNTHNRWDNDRTTKDWTIEVLDASNTRVFYTEGSEADFNPAVYTAALPVTTIDLQNAIGGRYVKFYVDSFYGFGGGLNELRVFESAEPTSTTPSPAVPTPEPGTGLLLFAGLLGLLIWKRKVVFKSEFH